MKSTETVLGKRIKLSIGMIATLGVIISLPLVTINHLSAQGIIPKIGNSCPHNYASDGSYCKPLKGAKEVIIKIGMHCPMGFASDGAYCYRIQSKPSRVIPKIGNSCPMGFTSDGAYCRSIN